MTTVSSERSPQGQRRLDIAILGLIFVLGLAPRLLYIKVTPGGDPRLSREDPHYFDMIARHLVGGQGFIEVGARAYRPPAYPFFLSLIYRVFDSSFGAAQVVLALLGALQPLLLALWTRVFASRRVGYLAGALAAVHPQFVRYPQTLYSEAFYLFMLALATLFLVRALRANSLPQMVLAGVTFGIAALTREVTVVMPVLVGLWFWLNRSAKSGEIPTSPRPWTVAQTPKFWLVFSLSMALTILPWTVRNYGIFGTLVPISTNAGFNFYMGNNPNSTLTPDFSNPKFWQLAPGVKWRNGAGELEAHQRGIKEGLRYIAANPGQTLKRDVQKALLFWMPPFTGYSGLSRSGQLIRAAWLIFTVVVWLLALFGIWKTRRSWRSIALPLLIVVAFSLPYVLSYIDVRYRLPMESFLLFYAALGLDALLQSRKLVPAQPLLNAFD